MKCPAGTYLIAERALSVPANVSFVDGGGRRATIKAADGFRDNLLIVNGANAVVSGLRFDANDANVTHTDVIVIYHSDVTIEDCEICGQDPWYCYEWDDDGYCTAWWPGDCKTCNGGTVTEQNCWECGASPG